MSHRTNQLLYQLCYAGSLKTCEMLKPALVLFIEVNVDSTDISPNIQRMHSFAVQLHAISLFSFKINLKVKLNVRTYNSSVSYYYKNLYIATK